MYMAVSFETVFVLLASGSLLYLSPLSGENNHISIWKFGKDHNVLSNLFCDTVDIFVMS